MATISAIIFILYMLSCIILWTQQRRLLYLPTPVNTREDVAHFWLEHDTQKLKIWHIKPAKVSEKTPIIIYFGGNGDAVDQYVDIFRAALSEQAPHAELYLPHYRGYGGSTGKPSERALYADAIALYDHIRASAPERPIMLIGRSLGSGVSTYLSSKREVDKLVLVTAYGSILRIAAEKFWIFPVQLLMMDRYLSGQYAAKVTAPTLLLTAEKDTLVPKAHTEMLFDALSSKEKENHIIKGAHHNDIFNQPVVLPQIAKFFASEALD